MLRTMSRLTALAAIPTPHLVEGAALAVGLAVFLVSVLPNLGNHPSVTDDEVWVLSASYKLATQGVFGSDIFQGFYHADQHYYFNMPAQHFVIAGALKLLGYGIAQARLVSVVYGVATLLLTYLLARRVYGVATAVMSLALAAVPAPQHGLRYRPAAAGAVVVDALRPGAGAVHARRLPGAAGRAVRAGVR